MSNSPARWPYHVAGWTYAVLCVGLVGVHRRAASLIMSDHPIPAYVLSPAAASEVAWFRDEAVLQRRSSKSRVLLDAPLLRPHPPAQDITRRALLWPEG